MRPKPIILLVLALGCGLVASVSINQVLAKKRTAPDVNLGETKPILVAMTDIESGEVVMPHLVKLEDWPIDRVPLGAMSDPTKTESRRTKTKIYAGEPVLEFKLLAPGQKDGASAVIPKGYRVVAVRVDDVSGGSSLIRPDDRVDVLVYLQENPSRGIKETTTRTVLQDIRVFAVNEIYSGRGSDAPDKGISARTISMLVTPDQAEKVTLACQLGEIRLVLRGREDIGEALTGGAKAHELLNGTDSSNRQQEQAAGTPNPPAPPANPLVDMIRQQAIAAAPPTVPAAPVEEEETGDLFKMVVIEGNTLKEVVFRDGKLAEGPSPVLPAKEEDSDEMEEDAEGDEDEAPTVEKTQAKAPRKSTLRLR